MGTRGRHHISNPTLLDNDDEEPRDRVENGRKSAQDCHSYEANKTEKEAKVKKMKKFKSFMHVFLGGLKKHSSQETWQEGDGNLYGGRYHQKKADSAAGTSISSVLTSPSLSPSEKQDKSFSSVHHGSTVETPGLCGLYNHGNTCFMNAILQCLSNTDQLAEYFVTDQYKNDLNQQKLATRSFGSQGDVTEQFAILLKCLWNCQYEPRVTSYFKEVIGKYASQYQGTSQHDAQEFFLWLLDSVHEDLNQASKKKYRPIKVSEMDYHVCYVYNALHL